jgi:hypothetical protein
MGRLKRSGALLLPVAEVDEILIALQAAKIPKDLSGSQRRQLAKAYVTLARARVGVKSDIVQVPEQVLRDVLRCISMTQRWFETMVAEHI